MYPVIIVEARDNPPELNPVDELAPEQSIEHAKAAATDAGYTVLDDDMGGNSETTDAWHPDRGTVHVVTVSK